MGLNFKNQEELLAYFADNSKHYTPKSITDLIVKYCKTYDFKNKSILEPSVGEGQLLISLLDIYEDMKTCKFTICDIEEQNLEISKARLINAGVEENNITCILGDFLNEVDKSWKFDYCFSNPPYGSKVVFNPNEWVKEVCKLGNKTKYTTPESYFSFITNLLCDKVINILPVGVLFRSGSENKVLEQLMRSNKGVNITLLPTNLFQTTSIPVILFITHNDNDNKKVYINDVSDLCSKNGKFNVINEEQQLAIMEVILGLTQTHLRRELSMQELEENKFNLNVTRYINRVIEEEIDIDKLSEEIDATISQMLELVPKYKELTKDIKKLLGE